MPEMPMIPGLMGGAEFPGVEETESDDPVETGRDRMIACLDSADPDSIAVMVAESQAALEAGELDSLMSGEPSDDDLQEGAPEDEEKGPDSDASPELDTRSAIDSVSGMMGEVESLQDELSKLEAVESESDADVDVAAALEVVTEAMQELEEALQEAEQASTDEDLDAAAEAKAKAEGAMQKAKEAADAVKGEAKDAAATLEEPPEPDPLLLWAQDQ